jgi:outer membrane murein-binding lipoprotein Lpp
MKNNEKELNIKLRDEATKVKDLEAQVAELTQLCNAFNTRVRTTGHERNR